MTQQKETVYVLTQDCTVHVGLIPLNLWRTRRQQKAGSMSTEISAWVLGKMGWCPLQMTDHKQ